jgi:hypothetical protein
MAKYKHWDIVDELPQGWKVDKTAGSPAPNTVFITDGKSVLNGQKRALLKIDAIIEKPKQQEFNFNVAAKDTADVNYTFPSKEVNNLARKKFQLQLLKEITFDLMVCEIEGWDKKEYIKELIGLIGSIKIDK